MRQEFFGGVRCTKQKEKKNNSACCAAVKNTNPLDIHVTVAAPTRCRIKERNRIIGRSPKPLLDHVLLLSPVTGADKRHRDGDLLKVCLDVLQGHLHGLVNGSADSNL